MKEWEAKFVGFSAPWWLLLQMLIPEYGQNWRTGIGWLVLVVGFLGALSVTTNLELTPTQIIASHYLRGIVSILALPLLALAIFVAMAIVASVFQLLGIV